MPSLELILPFRSLYDAQGQLVSLDKVNLRLRSSGVQNRMRRVVREQLICPTVLKMQNVRLDFIIETPPGWEDQRRLMHLKKVTEQLKVKSRGRYLYILTYP